MADRAGIMMCDTLPENCLKTMDECSLFMECVEFENVRSKMSDMFDIRSRAGDPIGP